MTQGAARRPGIALSQGTTSPFCLADTDLPSRDSQSLDLQGVQGSHNDSPELCLYAVYVPGKMMRCEIQFFHHEFAAA